MTVIIAQRTPDLITFATDSQGTSGYVKQRTQKLEVIDDMLVATTGTMSQLSLLRTFCHENAIKTADHKGVSSFFIEFYKWQREFMNKWPEEMNNYLLAKEMKLFYVASLQIDDISDVKACGTGREAAMGALNAGGTIREAVEAACDIDLYCSAPILMGTMTTKRIEVDKLGGTKEIHKIKVTHK